MVLMGIPGVSPLPSAKAITVTHPLLPLRGWVRGQGRSCNFTLLLGCFLAGTQRAAGLKEQQQQPWPKHLRGDRSSDKTGNSNKLQAAPPPPPRIPVEQGRAAADLMCSLETHGSSRGEGKTTLPSLKISFISPAATAQFQAPKPSCDRGTPGSPTGLGKARNAPPAAPQNSEGLSGASLQTLSQHHRLRGLSSVSSRIS